jgi:DNA topoisomerase-1
MAARSRKKSDTEGAAEPVEAPKKKAPAKKKGTPKAKAAAKKKAPARARKALVEVEASEGDGAARPAKAYSLVVVESPAKAKTIKKYLGPGYTVQASRGHVKDLPTSKLGVDVENGFEPAYVVAKGKEDVLSDLKKAARGAQSVFLATDPDREGEAIAWHLSEEMQHPNTHRVMFNEITRTAVQHAIQHPLKLDAHVYDSQQTRRILDRLVGYKISPLLWTKVRRGLSAGRVQSVAVRLVVDREAEIRAFVPVEYWTVDALLEGSLPPAFRARLVKVDGKKAELSNAEQTHALVKELRSATFQVAKVERKERRRNAPAPFITSKLQQEAANRLGFTAKRTMALAQLLYQGVPLGEEGQVALITYMRTDSTRLSDESVAKARAHIGDAYGAEFLPESPNVFRSKKGAQDAHEAIRPTSMEYPPEKVRRHLDDDMFRLYELIWNRFIACQMKPAVYDQTSAEISAGRTGFRATGSTLKFPGYLKVYGQGLTADEEAEAEKAKKEGADDATLADGNTELPLLTEGERLQLKGEGVRPEQHFTQPPPRFSEATLVKEMEESGIGRPSTYAAILSTIQEKKYVEKVEGRFRPTELGEITTVELVKHFPQQMDVSFTAGMEEQLDRISEGEVDWRRVLGEFYEPFEATLKKAAAEMRDVKREEIPTDVKCQKCGNPMVIKWGKMGRFLACTGYPDCKSTSDYKEIDGKIVPVEEETTDETCDKCSKPMVVKRGRFGRFLACSGYPECKGTRPMSIGVNCPDCKQGFLTERRSFRGKVFFGCNRYPECKFVAWDRPLAESCPQCQSPYLLQKYSKRDGPWVGCPNKECGYRRTVETGGVGETTEAPAN